MLKKAFTRILWKVEMEDPSLVLRLAPLKPGVVKVLAALAFLEPPAFLIVYSGPGEKENRQRRPFQQHSKWRINYLINLHLHT